jgi:hypothetical protein
MSMMRSQFQRHLFPGLYDIILDAWREKPLQFTQLYNVEKSDAAFEEVRTAAGMGFFVRTPEGMEASQDRFFDGYPKRYQHDDYSLAIGFSHQFLRDIKTRIARERSQDMGRSSRSTQEELNAAIINLANDSLTLGPDGVPLGSTAHPNIRGGTQSNIISPVSLLSVTGYRLALTKFRRFFDDTGVRRIQLDPAWLVVPPEEEFNAKEIVKSMGRPDTANRADNVTRDATGVFVYDYQSDTNNWAIFADKSQHKLRVFQRETFNVKEFEEEKPRIMWVAGYFSQSFGWDHWMGTVWSFPS